MTDRTQKYLFDIQEAILEIESFLSNSRNFNEYQQNTMLKRAVERSLTIIGEATNRILAIDPNITISAARRIVQFRNKITHEYDGVEDVNVWSILKNQLPILKAEVLLLLNP